MLNVQGKLSFVESGPRLSHTRMDILDSRGCLQVSKNVVCPPPERP